MSAYPKRFDDDGNAVTVDLHGCSVRDGLYIARRCIQEGYRRGRGKVEVIHGTSTSGRGHERTIKNELLQQLQSGRFDQWASGHMVDPSGGRTTVFLHLGVNPNLSRIQLRDVVPR